MFSFNFGVYIPTPKFIYVILQFYARVWSTYVRMPIRQYAPDEEAVHLRQRFHSDQASEGQLGWHGHDLLRECSTTLFSFVTHDDTQILYI
jgi:hypothetical protein